MEHDLRNTAAIEAMKVLLHKSEKPSREYYKIASVSWKIADAMIEKKEAVKDGEDTSFENEKEAAV